MHGLLNGLLGIDVLVSYLVRAVVMLIVIPFHEAAHALVSWLLGDPTAKNAGRLSLNPVRHFDLMGAVCMVVAGVGWASRSASAPIVSATPRWAWRCPPRRGPRPTCCWRLCP